ncbi:unnamed protein product [Enterobius vermicularis]|uniref:GTP-binding protein n=1 Tax=Enterobius vermicularis TaxID=51028 RepID=A0A0N4VLK9_ENTVE|nr:unnamed protein product [Enterobius vermicularis]
MFDVVVVVGGGGGGGGGNGASDVVDFGGTVAADIPEVNV